jgi:peptidoglycan/xylan/chitin deacetylase (PgdA/CDA1 family)
MRRLFYILAICALALSSCAKKSTRIEELKEKYDKFVALTFDDGPSTLTPRILDILEKYDATATFFVIGGQVDATTEPTIRRAVELGCEIGSHSFTHPYMSKLSKQEQLEQSEQTIAAIEKYAPTPKYFRPPYMDADDTTHNIVPQIFIGGYCPDDWDANVSAEERIKGLMENATDGLIFILHDFKDNNGTAEALASVIPALQAQGYGLVSVDELFTIKGVTPQKGIIYKKAK